MDEKICHYCYFFLSFSGWCSFKDEVVHGAFSCPDFHESQPTDDDLVDMAYDRKVDDALVGDK